MLMHDSVPKAGGKSGKPGYFSMNKKGADKRD